MKPHEKEIRVHCGHFKAITTKYIGPTERRGSRVKAFDGDGHSVTIGFDSSLSSAKAHAKAAEALCRKMNWSGTLVSGGIRGGEVFVFVDDAALLPENSIRITFANAEDQEAAFKILSKQIWNAEQSMSGLYASLFRAAVQRAQGIIKGY